MSKSIKVSEDVYLLLLEMQRPRETFSEEVQRLLTAAALLMKIEPLIRGSHEFYKRHQEQCERKEADDLRGGMTELQQEWAKNVS